MLNRLNNLLLLIVLAAFVIGLVNIGQATETRLSSMGGVGYFTRDNTNIFYFPGTIKMYPGLVIAELRTKNTQDSYTIGGNFKFNDDKVLGVYLNRPINLVNYEFAVNYVANLDYVELNNTTDFLMGMPLGDWNFGCRLSLAFDSYKQDSTATDYGDDETAHYINVGLGLSNEKIDVGVHFEMPSAKSTEENGLEDKISGTGFGIVARMFTGEKMQFVPVGLLKVSSAKYDHTFNNATTTDKFSGLNLSVGAGLNYQVSDNALIVAAVEAIGLSKLKAEFDGGPKTTVTAMDFPGIYLGAESQINKWLIGRIGAVQVMQGTKTKVEDQGVTESETTVRTKHYRVTFGLGIALGDFKLDVSLNEGLLFDGPNFISGTTETIADKISLTYEF